MENRILATVNGQPVTEADVNEFLAGLGQRGKSYDNPQGRAMILTQLVNSKLFLIDAQRNLIEAEPAFKEQLRRVKENLLSNYAVEKLIAGITVTDAEAEKYYQDNADKFLAGETVNASHILVDSEETARDIARRIKAGEITFEDAAKQYSSCPSKEEGGNLGDFGKGQMVPEFDQAVFAMEEGAMTDEPVKTQFGYHLIRLNKKNPAAKVAFADVRDQIKEQLLRDKQTKAYESRVNQLKILYPVDMLG